MDRLLASRWAGIARASVAFVVGVLVFAACGTESSTDSSTGSTGSTAASVGTTAGTADQGSDQELLECIHDRDPGASAVFDAMSAGDTATVSDADARAFLDATARCYASVAELDPADTSCYVEASLAVIDERGPGPLLGDLAAVSAGEADVSLITDPVDAQMLVRCPDRATAIRAQVDAISS